MKNERAEKIMEILEIRKHASVEYLVNELHYSPATIRRDITMLEKSGIAKKSYGGVSINEHSKSIILREHEYVEEKKKIALAATKLISDNDTVFIVGSSTTHIMGTHITDRKNITIVTPDIRLAFFFNENGIKCYCIGGKVSDNMMTGCIAINTIRQMHFDICFFSISAISNDGNMSSPSEDFAQMVRELIPRSDKTVCLCTSNKFERNRFISCGDLDNIDYLITDTPCQTELVSKYPATQFIVAD